ncbi:MAG: hypothetical protein MJ168_05950, partial [Clostridia bacterium]|nr:hypothetical protein [Clostridia bacterium]
YLILFFRRTATCRFDGYDRTVKKSHSERNDFFKFIYLFRKPPARVSYDEIIIDYFIYLPALLQAFSIPHSAECVSGLCPDNPQPLKRLSKLLRFIGSGTISDLSFILHGVGAQALCKVGETFSF